MRGVNTAGARYSLALLATVLALVLRSFITPFLGDSNPYHTVWAAVVFSAWYCGLGPSIITAISSALGVWFFFLPPYYSFAIQSPADRFGLMGFLLLSGFIVALGEANRRAESTQFHQAHLLDLANDAIIELDIGDDTIKYWNQGAEKLYGWSKSEALGKRIHTLLRTVFPASLDESKAVLKRQGHWEGEAIHTRRDGTQIHVASLWTLRPIEAESTTWLEINRDITERKEAEQEVQKAYGELENRVKERTAELEQSNQTLRLLSVRLMRAQDDERRRIARELHDSAGQYLAAAIMALEMVNTEAKSLPASLTRKLEEAAQVTKACISEIRTLSHLLHPPLLEELGLASAVNRYAEGFAARSGIRIQLEIPEGLDRLGSDVEIALFRILQESLTNVYRYSGSKTATIKIGADSDWAWLEVQDQGKGSGDGFSAPFPAGVGITGMRERVKDLAGVLEITSDQSGTRVKAVIPLSGRTS
jgi:PAS domain S-box-containing protein